MLIRDGEQLNLNKKELDETELWVKEELQRIKKSKNVFIFKSTMKPTMLPDDYGREHVDHRGRSIPTVTIYNNPITGLTENWQLLVNAGSYKKRGDGSIDVRREPGILITTDGRFFDPEKHTEQIFFLLHLSGAVKSRLIYLEDKQLEAKRLDEELMIQDMALNMIMNPSSVISEEITGSLDTMKQLAISWGVPNVERLTASELKINLRKAVIASQDGYVSTRRGFKEFLADANRVGDTEKRATILLAIERNILHFEDNTWSVRTRGGGLQMLRSIPIGEENKKDDWIIRFLSARENESFYTLVHTLLTEPVSEKVVSLEREMTKAEMLAYCKKDLKWPHNKVFGKTEDDLKRIVVEHLEYQE